MVRRSWRRTTRQYAEAYPHHVVLRHTDYWRSAHLSYALAHLQHGRYRWWTEGSHAAGDVVSVWGFLDIEDAVTFEMWATSSGIDWNVPALEQPPETRPPAARELPIRHHQRRDGGR